MHNYLEGYVLNGEIKKAGSNPYAKEAHIMAAEIIDKGLGDITEYWGAEVDLYYPNIYAGATDLVGEHKGIPAIMDFKQSNKPKTDSRVADYKIQLTAYAEAHNELYKTNINRGVIIMCVKPDNPSPGVYVNPQYQEWVVESKEFDKCRKIWWQRVEEYYVNNPS
jgi:genome maintenance exonuclease 1